MRPIDIAPADLETVRCILREHAPGLEVRAFGSRVSFTARETSDLDLALLTEEPLSIARMTNLKAAFTKSYLPFRVDIVDWASTTESFRKVIKSEYVVLVEHKVERDYEEWRTLPLGKCANLSRDNVSPSEAKDAIYIGLEHIGENTLSLVGYGSANDVKSAKTRFQNGDILFGKLRPYFRKVVLVNFDGICSTDIWVIRASEEIHQRFLYYNIASQSLVDFATLTSEGTRMPRAKWNYLSEYELQIPTYSHQCAIANILGTLDDKIELNHRMNKTLEEIAQALFKSWFVDFEPVKAKLAVLEKGGTADEAERAAMCAISGKDEITLAKLENEQFKAFANLAQTAAQFPSAMQDSELGKIPKDWDACNLGDVVTSVRGRSYRSSELSPSDTALVTLKSFERGGGYRADGLKSFTGKYYANQVVQPGEIVIACTDVTQAADVIGRPAIVQSSNAYKSLVASLDTLIVRPNSKNITRSFLYYLTKSSVFTSHTNAYSTGTTVLHLAKEAIPLFQFPLPPPQLIDTFDKLAKSAIELIRINNLESESLVSTRNCLLPKLVSGEVRVQEFYNQKIQNLEIP